MRYFLYLGLALSALLLLGCAPESAYNGGTGGFKDYESFDEYGGATSGAKAKPGGKASKDSKSSKGAAKGGNKTPSLESSASYEPPVKGDGHFKPTKSLLGGMRDSEAIQRATMRPYKIRGKTYTPHPVKVGDTFDGVASWYGPDFHARATSNGETYNMNAHTAAHKTLPMNTIVKVFNKDNGRTTVVRINDRGPFVEGRIIDLSNIAAKDIQMVGKGLANVRLEVVGFGGDLAHNNPSKAQEKNPKNEVKEASPKKQKNDSKKEVPKAPKEVKTPKEAKAASNQQARAAAPVASMVTPPPVPLPTESTATESEELEPKPDDEIAVVEEDLGQTFLPKDLEEIEESEPVTQPLPAPLSNENTQPPKAASGDTPAEVISESKPVREARAPDNLATKGTIDPSEATRPSQASQMEYATPVEPTEPTPPLDEMELARPPKENPPSPKTISQPPSEEAMQEAAPAPAPAAPKQEEKPASQSDEELIAPLQLDAALQNLMDSTKRLQNEVEAEHKLITGENEAKATESIEKPSDNHEDQAAQTEELETAQKPQETSEALETASKPKEATPPPPPHKEPSAAENQEPIAKKGSHMVSLNVFSQEERAIKFSEDMRARFEDLPYDIDIVRTDKGLYRVALRGFSSISEAKEFIARENISGHVVAE